MDMNGNSPLAQSVRRVRLQGQGLTRSTDQIAHAVARAWQMPLRGHRLLLWRVAAGHPPGRTGRRGQARRENISLGAARVPER
eukprot:10257301-Alexandrium_andersonii.AAC.1